MVTCSLPAPATCDDTRCYGSPCDYDRVQTPRDSTEIWSIFGVVFFILRMERFRIWILQDPPWVYGFSCLFLFEFDDISAWGHFSLQIGGKETDFFSTNKLEIRFRYSTNTHTHVYINRYRYTCAYIYLDISYDDIYIFVASLSHTCKHPHISMYIYIVHMKNTFEAALEEQTFLRSQAEAAGTRRGSWNRKSFRS